MDTEITFPLILISAGVVLLSFLYIINRKDKERFEKSLNKRDESKAYPPKEEEEKI